MSLVPPIEPDVSGLLAGQAQQTGSGGSADSDTSRELAARFESIFTSLLLKEMRQSIGEEGLFGGDNSDVFGGLFDLYMGEHIAKSTNLGIGDMVSKYIDAQKKSDAENPNI